MQRACALAAVSLLTTFGWLGDAAAFRPRLRATLEPGGSSLTVQNGPRQWSWFGGLAADLGITDLISIEGLWERREFGDNSAVRKVETAALLANYRIDVLPLAPFFELGLASSAVTAPEPDGGRSLVPILGLGFDFALLPSLQVGAVARYQPLLGSDLLGSPAYMSLNARVSLCAGYD